MKRITIFSVLAVLTYVTPIAAQASGGVFVHAQGQVHTRYGVGLLRPRHAGECFVITPRHVILPDQQKTDTTEVDYADHIEVTSTGRVRRSAVLEADRYSLDAVILRIKDEVGRSECPAWPDTRRIGRALRHAERDSLMGQVQTWDRTGQSTRARLRVQRVLDSEFTVSPMEDTIQPGMSGSLVYVERRPVGILVSRQADGTGRVIRLDYIEGNIGRFFVSTPNPYAPAAFVPFVSQWHTRRRGLAVAWAATSVAAFFVMHNFPGEGVEWHETQRPDKTIDRYADTVRIYPMRQYRWGAVGVSAFLSVVEGFRHANRYYIPSQQGESPSRQSPSVSAVPVVGLGREGDVHLQIVTLNF